MPENGPPNQSLLKIKLKRRVGNRKFSLLKISLALPGSPFRALAVFVARARGDGLGRVDDAPQLGGFVFIWFPFICFQ
jgi:hypothetical protein